MYLPNRETAYVPTRKLADYLLSEVHPVGRAKAKFFRAAGFTQDDVELLEQGLLRIVREEEVEREILGDHGTKYVIPGDVKTPVGQTVRLRTVWIVEYGDNRPRFVTAFPA